MLHLVHRVTISIKLRPVKPQQAVGKSLPHKGLILSFSGSGVAKVGPGRAKALPTAASALPTGALPSGFLTYWSYTTASVTVLYVRSFIRATARHAGLLFVY